MISYSPTLKPPGFDAPITTLNVTGRACCARTLSKIANNAAFIFDWAHTTSMQTEDGVDHAESHSNNELDPPCHDTPTETQPD